MVWIKVFAHRVSNHVALAAIERSAGHLSGNSKRREGNKARWVALSHAVITALFSRFPMGIQTVMSKLPFDMSRTR